MTTGVTQTVVIIVGAGPSGLSTAASLHQLSIPYIILEREKCIASIFNNKSYHRFHLHLDKNFCELPHMGFPANFPTYVPRKDFLKYLNDYATRFEINPMFHNFVKGAKFDEDRKKWRVEVEVGGGGRTTAEDGGGRVVYEGEFLVVATGETSDAFIPEVDGLSEFKGEVIHSTEYKSGEGFEGKRVLVVGAGNSGMEIALDLCNYGAKTSIVVRSPIHITPRWSINLGFKLLTHIKFIPWQWVDSFLVLTSKMMYGDLTKYGIQRPKEGPLFLKARDNRYPIIDVGTAKKIKSGEIQVLPGLKSIQSGGSEVVFENGKCYHFDTILFATGFKRSTHLWLQDTSRGTTSQELVVKDLHGGIWNFHHICHGRRNLLTSGWGKFVSTKRLMAGDTCIFLRGQNELYIGIQRAVRLQKPSTDLFGVTMQHGILVTALDAIGRSAEFKVYYHPWTSPSRFIVAYDEFVDSLEVNYSPNMNVEMLFDGGGEDPMQNLKRFSGIIIGKEDIDPAKWPQSEWRSLKVRWDTTTGGHVLPERVSPWSIQSLDLAAQDQQSFVSLGRKRSVPFQPTNFRSSKTNGQEIRRGTGFTLSKVNLPSSSCQNPMNFAQGVGRKYKLFGVDIWDGKSGVLSRYGTSQLSISKGTLKQQSRNYSVVTAHHYIKVLKHGTALGRSVDLSRYIGYEGLIGELDRMFEFGGTLVSGTSGWVVTYADRYGNKMLLCDHLWSQFKAVVRKMTIESAATVN